MCNVVKTLIFSVICKAGNLSLWDTTVCFGCVCIYKCITDIEVLLSDRNEISTRLGFLMCGL
jgi:hypothetical protein